MGSKNSGKKSLGRDTAATVSHAHSILGKLEAKRARREAGGTRLELEAQRYAQQVEGGKKVEAAYLAGASRELDSQGRAEDAQILIEELYGPGEPEGWQLDNARSALARLAERRTAR